MRRRRDGQQIHDHRLIPADQRMTDVQAVVRRPVPVEDIAVGRLAVPVPLDFPPEPCDRVADLALRGRVAIEVLSCRPAVPASRKAVSTRSPPLSYLPKYGRTLPVRPSRKCGHTPWKRSAFARKRTIFSIRSTPWSRVMNRRSDPDDERHDPEAGCAEGHQVLVARQNLHRHARHRIRRFPVVAKAGFLNHVSSSSSVIARVAALSAAESGDSLSWASTALIL